MPDVPEGACSFCLPGYRTPKRFSHRSKGSTVTFQLSSLWAKSEFLGFSLCAVITFRSFSHGLQVKCTYRFRNKHGDRHDLNCYIHGWYDEKKRMDSAHIFVGFDPCLVAIKDDMFNKYSEVSVEFQPEPIDGNHLTFYPCKVRECGVRLLHAKGENEMQRLDLIMPSSFCFYPLDRNKLEPRFQAKRARKS